MAKIVTIGGGKGQPELLRYLAEYPHDITAVVSVMDNGGSSGQLRKAYNVLAPGDVRRCITALAPDAKAADELWNYRFSDGPLAEHTVGNLVLAGYTKQLGSLQKAIDLSTKQFASRGRVLAVTEELVDLCAELEDGEVITGETDIDIPQHEASLHIAKLFLQPQAQATAEVIDALKNADMIVLTMGDVFTSVLPNLLVTGVVDAIAQSHAKVVAVCNRSTKYGETHGFTSQDFCATFQKYLAPATLHLFIEDTGEYTADGIEFVRHADLADTSVQLVRRDIAVTEKPQYISGKKVAAVINELCTS